MPRAPTVYLDGTSYPVYARITRGGMRRKKDPEAAVRCDGWRTSWAGGRRPAATMTGWLYQVPIGCTHPSIELVSAVQAIGIDAWVGTVTCTLGAQSRADRFCTASLVDATGTPLSIGGSFLTADGAGFGRGQALDITGAAEFYVRDNLWRTFYEVHFASDVSQSQSSVLPKLPALWAASGLGLAWHYDQWRLYFDNNRPALGGYGQIGNVIHLVTGADYRSPEEPWSVDAAGFSEHTINTAVIHEPAFNPGVYAQVWAHEVFHQFNINHCDRDVEDQVLDHCAETSAIKLGEPPVCLMSNDLTSQGNYLGIDCATPLGLGHGRAVCVEQVGSGGDTRPNHIRYWNLLNEAP